MSFQTTFEGNPVLSWVIDDWEQFFEAIKTQAPYFNLDEYIKEFKDNVYNDKLSLLFDSAPISMNLGGDTVKSKLVATDKPIGVFDFSLAAMGMYKVPEYYSEKLAKEFPDRFIEFELPSGIVPPDLITQTILPNGEYKYVYIDNGIEFDCIIQQKGTAAIEQGVKGATKKYATTNKKVYLTFKKNKGKVKYVEIYSVFNFGYMQSRLQYAIRHIPAMMVAEYFESIGIKTRIYATRFVQLKKQFLKLKEFLPNDTTVNQESPLYEKAPNKQNKLNLFIQPIIAKDFGEELDKAKILSIPQQYGYSDIYQHIANYTLSKETFNPQEFNSRLNRYADTSYEITGNINFTEIQMAEGYERYRNKYQEYVKLGIFKSKEVLPNAMIFYFDEVLNRNLNDFITATQKYFLKYKKEKTEKIEHLLLIDLNVNPFFVWWMRLSANNIKHKVNIINSKELKKDLISIEKDLYRFKEELDEIVKNTPDPIKNDFINFEDRPLKSWYKIYGYSLLRKYKIVDFKDDITFSNYVLYISTDLTTYAEGVLFETPKDREEFNDELFASIQETLKDI